jgi:hypothetical protein
MEDNGGNEKVAEEDTALYSIAEGANKKVKRKGVKFLGPETLNHITADVGSDHFFSELHHV